MGGVQKENQIGPLRDPSLNANITKVDLIPIPKHSKYHKKMISYLKEDPSLSLLLKSEVLKIEKKFPELNNIYEDMIKSKKTEALGYRGLMEQNL